MSSSSTRISAGSPRAICGRARRSISKGRSRPANGRTSPATTAIRPRSCFSASGASWSCSTAAKAAGGGRGALARDFDGDDFGGGGAGRAPSRVRSRRRSTPTSTTTSRSRSCRRSFFSFGEHCERARLLFAQHARFLERRVGARAARIGIEAERQRVGDRAAEVDRRAVVEDDVAIRSAELDLLVGPPSSAARARTAMRTARRHAPRPARR